jgi:hypothetical protein
MEYRDPKWWVGMTFMSSYANISSVNEKAPDPETGQTILQRKM